MAKTLYEKLFDAHVVYEAEGETPILYIDAHAKIARECTDAGEFGSRSERAR